MPGPDCRSRYKLLTLVYAAWASVLCGVTSGQAEPAARGPFGAAEWERSATPLRPGKPGEAPFWNAHAKRFIFAPAFDFKRVEGAVRYRFEITSRKDASVHRFESDAPFAALSPVWTNVPVGNFELKVTGISARGEAVGLAGEGQYFRAAPYDGPYLEPVMPYDRSGRLALEKVLEKKYVQHWLTHKEPDWDYYFYRYPAKLFGSLVVGDIIPSATIQEGDLTTGDAGNPASILGDITVTNTGLKPWTAHNYDLVISPRVLPYS